MKRFNLLLVIVMMVLVNLFVIDVYAADKTVTIEGTVKSGSLYLIFNEDTADSIRFSDSSTIGKTILKKCELESICKVTAVVQGADDVIKSLVSVERIGGDESTQQAQATPPSADKLKPLTNALGRPIQACVFISDGLTGTMYASIYSGTIYMADSKMKQDGYIGMVVIDHRFQTTTKNYGATVRMCHEDYNADIGKYLVMKESSGGQIVYYKARSDDGIVGYPEKIKM